MFKSKAPPPAPTVDPRDEGWAHAWEYKTLVTLGVEKFDVELNDHAKRGWELINGCMAGTAHYGYLRRPIR